MIGVNWWGFEFINIKSMHKQIFRLLLLVSLLALNTGAFAAIGPFKKKNAKKDMLVTITTQFGQVKLILFDDTPLHKANFLKLAGKGFYDHTTFHRIIDNFMIQGGDGNTKDDDPANDGAGDIGYRIPAEILPVHRHVRGAVAAARQGDQVNPERASSGTQFYIVENHQGTPFLDNAYTVFGQVISGLEVVDKIAEQPKGFMDRPVTPIRMTVKVEKLKKKKISQLYGYQFPAAT
jgi:cyclophilin family peptidyl-prolyl cis-trans isomerase